ncbi:hypothetical protein COCNU_scaffold008155G000010 [Cocos nucifera]|nr:hypothetical protein [Cocos nucifera]
MAAEAECLVEGKMAENESLHSALRKKEFISTGLKAALALEEEEKKEARLKVAELEAQLAKSISESPPLNQVYNPPSPIDTDPLPKGVPLKPLIKSLKKEIHYLKKKLKKLEDDLQASRKNASKATKEMQDAEDKYNSYRITWVGKMFMLEDELKAAKDEARYFQRKLYSSQQASWSNESEEIASLRRSVGELSEAIKVEKAEVQRLKL